MAKPWRSWIVPGPKLMERDSERRFREDFDLSERFALTPRAEAWLDFSGGNWSLGTAGVKARTRFFDEVDLLQQERGGDILAVTFLPIEALEKLQNAALWNDSRRYQVEWLGHDVSVFNDPYARRLLRIQRGQLHTARAHTETQISNTDVRGLCPLILDPIDHELDDTMANACASGRSEVWFFPPTRYDPEGGPDTSYFSAERLRVRQALRQLLETAKRDDDEPVTALIERLCDDLAIRDVLIEGGSLYASAGRKNRTVLALDVCGGSQVAAARQALLTGTAPATPDWAQALAREIKRDLVHVIQGGTIQAGATPLDWSVRPQSSRENPTAIEGDWHQLGRLKDEIAKADGKIAGSFNAHVLRLSNFQEMFDHALAVHLFSANFWRAFWKGGDGADASQPAYLACLRLLHRIFDEKAQAADVPKFAFGGLKFSGAALWASLLGHGLGRQDATRILYSGNPSDADIELWRLLYPLGTEIQARTLCLDDGERSRTSSGYVLA